MEILCNLNWELVIEAIEVLIWPLIIVILLSVYKSDVKYLITRISKSRYFKTPIFEADLSEVDSDIINKSLSSYNTIVHQSNNFFVQNLEERKRRAKVIFNEGQNISNEILENIIASSLDDLKLAGLIVLNSKLQKKQITITKKETNYLDFIESGLNHQSSIIRFRAVETIKNNEYLKKHFKKLLIKIDKNETNNAVKMMIKFALEEKKKD